MKIQILDKSDSEVRFIAEEISSALAGELRRIMLSEIPTMSIEFVDFKKNDSALPDEIVANRLGQVPLTYDKRAYNLPGECKCKGKGCSRCQVKLSLKKKAPGVVYASDLKSNDKSVRPFFEKIPIVELFEDQEMQFSAVAQLGKGKQHAKWQAAVVGYKNVPRVVVNVKAGKRADELIAACPKHLLKINKDKIVVTDPLDCNMCKQCLELAKEGEIKIEPIEDSFLFNVETASGLKSEEIVTMATEILEANAKQFEKSVKKIK
jgi:DNA-directed RNA polymerase subunit D